MIESCKNHLHHVGEDYFTHMRFALKIAGLTTLATFFLVVHAILPCFFLDNGSRTIEKINAILAARKAAAHDHHNDHDTNQSHDHNG